MCEFVTLPVTCTVAFKDLQPNLPFCSLVCLRVVGTNNRAIQKYAKNCCHKTTWAINLMTPIHFSGALAFMFRLDYCIQEAVLSQRAARCGLHNSVQLGLCSPELNFSLFCDILGEWTWPNRMFFTKYAWHYMLQACENCEECASVCLTLKNVLLLNSSRNNSSVDNVPSQ